MSQSRDDTSPRRIRPSRPGQRLGEAARPLRPRAVAVGQQLGSFGPKFFEDAGYVAPTGKWLHDPESVVQVREHPEAFAYKGIADVAAHHQTMVKGSIASLPSSATPSEDCSSRSSPAAAWRRSRSRSTRLPPEACSHCRCPR